MWAERAECTQCTHSQREFADHHERVEESRLWPHSLRIGWPPFDQFGVSQCAPSQRHPTSEVRRLQLTRADKAGDLFRPAVPPRCGISRNWPTFVRWSVRLSVYPSAGRSIRLSAHSPMPPPLSLPLHPTRLAVVASERLDTSRATAGLEVERRVHLDFQTGFEAKVAVLGVGDDVELACSPRCARD